MTMTNDEVIYHGIGNVEILRRGNICIPDDPCSMVTQVFDRYGNRFRHHEKRMRLRKLLPGDIVCEDQSSLSRWELDASYAMKKLGLGLIIGKIVPEMAYRYQPSIVRSRSSCSTWGSQGELYIVMWFPYSG